MKILILSKQGDGLGIAQRMQDEGHSVDIWIQDPSYKLSGKGIVGRPAAWRPKVAGADLIICDMVGFGHLESTLRRMGKQPLGCDQVTQQAELDRSKGVELFKKVGINIPETVSFSSPGAAKQAWREGGVVVKPSGNISTAKTFVCPDEPTYLYALSQVPQEAALLVQELVTGVEVSTEGWWNGRSWIKPFNHTFEEKRFLNGGLGPNTGSMGSVVTVARSPDRLVRGTVKRLESFLKQTAYRGPVDINCIVTKDSLYALELTARLGYDAIEALAEGLLEPLADVLFETAAGVKKEMDIESLPMTAVRVSVPPWPHAAPSASEIGRPLVGLNRGNLKHVYLTDVFKDGDQFKFAGGDGVVYKATANGRSFRESRRRVYRTIGNIGLLDSQYRTDIGERVDPDLPHGSKDWARLKEWGWI